MSVARNFIQRSVLESIGPVGARNAAFSQVVLRPVQNPHAMEITVRTTKEMSIVESVISGRIGGSDITETKIDDDNWERLAFRVADALPPALLALDNVKAEFSGQWSDDSPITPAFGNSIINTIIEGSPSTEEDMNVINVNFAGARTILDAVAATALEHVAGGSSQAAQICVREGEHPTWVNVDTVQTGGDTYYYAATNDSDMLIGTPPSFVARCADPAELADAIVAFFAAKFAGVRNFTVQVFLRDATGTVKVLEGTSATGELAEKAELPTD